MLFCVLALCVCSFCFPDFNVWCCVVGCILCLKGLCLFCMRVVAGCYHCCCCVVLCCGFTFFCVFKTLFWRMCFVVGVFCSVFLFVVMWCCCCMFRLVLKFLCCESISVGVCLFCVCVFVCVVLFKCV